MTFGTEQMNNIIKKMVAMKLPYVDSIIIGDNSSGKTLLLKHFIESVKNREGIYFIDAVNRGFDVKKVSKPERKPGYKTTILETRMQEEYFNVKDSFNYFGTLTERVEMIYPLYEKEIQDLFYEITKERFGILYGNLLGEVDFGNGRGLLSSGYQALIRILTELLYYQDVEIDKKQIMHAWVIVDEVDEFLSPRYSANILNFLRKGFPWARWIVTTHSCDLVAYTQDANLIMLEKGNCEVVDINDYRSVSEVQLVFERLFGKHDSLESEIENDLRRLLNNKINQAWSEIDEMRLAEIEAWNLTASQQMIVRQIQEW